jgi:hypothetical protein
MMVKADGSGIRCAASPMVLAQTRPEAREREGMETWIVTRAGKRRKARVEVTESDWKERGVNTESVAKTLVLNRFLGQNSTKYKEE